MRWNVIRFALIAVTIYGCVNYVTFDVPDPDQTLVVDGLITNEPGPYTVNLSYESNVHEARGYAIPAIAQSVVIFDDAGNSEILESKSKGVYQTKASGIQGQIGRQYHVEIVLSSGRRYQSKPELLSPVSNIDSLYFEFVTQDQVLGLGNALPAHGFNIYIDTHALTGQQSFMRWQWTGTFKIFTHPEWAHYIPPNGRPMVCYLPLPCSGWFATGCFTVKESSSPCLCCTCWVRQHQITPAVSDDQFIADAKFSRVRIAFIPSNQLSIPAESFDRGVGNVTGIPFYDKYYFEIKQLSLTQASHDFWKLLNFQKTTSGSLFQPPTAKIKGNMFSITDSQEEVLGIFSASGVTKKSIYIHRGDIPYVYAGANDVYADDCRNYDSSATTTQPAFWQND